MTISRGSRLAGLLLPAGFLLASACGRTFTAADFVERTRIVASRVVPEADPTRAWLLPGEHATVELLVVSPGVSDALDAVLTACPASLTDPQGGAASPPRCAAPDFSVPPSSLAPALAPRLSFELDVPVDIPTGLTDELLVFVGSCIGAGPPVLDTRLPGVTCPADARAELYDVAVHVLASALGANHHPSLSDEPFTLNMEDWGEPPADLPLENCVATPSSPGLPHVSASHPAPMIELACSADDLEMYPAFDADRHAIVARESLTIRHYVTSGSMPGTTRIDEASELMGTVTWTPPAAMTLPAEGTLVRFWFIASDHRGGTDWVERDLCLTP